MSSITATPGGRWHGWPTWHHATASHPARHRGARKPPGMTAGERILTRADQLGSAGSKSTRAGTEVIGTDRAIHLRSENSAWRRIAWIDIASAAWSPDEAETVLRLWPGDADTGSEPKVFEQRVSELRVPTDHGFAAFAGERVLATQVLCRRVQLTSAVAATVTALHESGAETVSWQVRLDPGAENSVSVAIAAQSVLADLRSLAGC
jgi:hypothetical protein